MFANRGRDTASYGPMRSAMDRGEGYQEAKNTTENENGTKRGDFWWVSFSSLQVMQVTAHWVGH
jgi:hypothetical protein